jgi:hypothetical protein
MQHDLAGNQNAGQGDMLAALPRAISEAAAAAVAAAHAQTHLLEVQQASTALQADGANAASLLPQFKAAATEASKALTKRAPALLKVRVRSHRACMLVCSSATE